MVLTYVAQSHQLGIIHPYWQPASKPDITDKLHHCINHNAIGARSASGNICSRLGLSLSSSSLQALISVGLVLYASTQPVCLMRGFILLAALGKAGYATYPATTCAGLFNTTSTKLNTQISAAPLILLPLLKVSNSTWAGPK